MDWIDVLVERRLEEANERGILSNLPLSGRPLPEDPLAELPAALRPAARLLKGAGHLPEEVHLLRRISSLDGLLRHASAAEGQRLSVERSLLAERLELARRRRN